MNLTHAPLLLLRVAQDPKSEEWLVLLQLHHVIGDNLSQELVISEVVAHLEGRADELPPSVPYRNHVAHALSYAGAQDEEAFFRAKLMEVDEPTAPFGVMEVHGEALRTQEWREPVDDELGTTIRKQARRLGVSAATLFHAAWGLVVAHTSGRDDVVFGSVLLGRMHSSAGSQRILGMFINTLPLRLQLQALNARQLVDHTQRELVDLLNHEQASLAIAQRCSGIAGAAPLFTTLFNYRHNAVDVRASWSDAPGVHMIAAHDRTNYPIAFSVDDLGERFELIATTDHRIDAQRLTRYMSTAVGSLVNALEHDDARAVLELGVLPEQERRCVIVEFNATRRPFPADRTLQDLFEENARRAPDTIAISAADQELTYSQINARANQWARYLGDRGAQPGQYVAVLMSRGVDLLVVQLAILKTGAAYAPIDPAFPLDRQHYIIRDCAARLVIVSSAATVWSDLNLEIIDASQVRSEVEEHPSSNLPGTVGALAPAYVMYTSGSTGTPKGVVVPHRAVARMAVNNGYAELNSRDCIAHISNPTFDASTFEVWGAWLNGARVAVIDPETVLDSRVLADTLRKHRVTVMLMTTSLFHRAADILGDSLRQLRYLLVGGDVLDPAIARRVLRANAPEHMLNAYGPTEGTVFASMFSIDSLGDEVSNVPIGRPISNTSIYILGPGFQPAPLGAVGEIYIGGPGVANGYLNRSDLTAARFTRDPFADEPTARMYRTGDLGRWREDGAVEYVGRADQQVKIRGFRIEPGEIEAHVARHEQVREVVVIQREDSSGNKRIVAYLTLHDHQRLDVAQLRERLKRSLPEFMVPSAFVVLAELPLTPTGKLDRRALPSPQQLEDLSGGQHDAPQGEFEVLLARIWEELLEVQRVGRTDDFFDLGGHSLLAMQVAARMEAITGLSVPVRYLLQHRTIQDLAARLQPLWIAHQRDLMSDAEELERLREEVGSLSESRVEELLRELRMEEGRL